MSKPLNNMNSDFASEIRKPFAISTKGARCKDQKPLGAWSVPCFVGSALAMASLRSTPEPRVKLKPKRAHSPKSPRVRCDHQSRMKQLSCMSQKAGTHRPIENHGSIINKATGYRQNFSRLSESDDLAINNLPINQQQSSERNSREKAGLGRRTRWTFQGINMIARIWSRNSRWWVL